MTTVNMLEAKSNLSRLVEAVESGREKEIVIARNGKPVARLVPVTQPAIAQRIGVAKDWPDIPDDIDAANAEIEKMFLGDDT